jgi:hypothetical protein
VHIIFTVGIVQKSCINPSILENYNLTIQESTINIVFGHLYDRLRNQIFSNDQHICMSSKKYEENGHEHNVDLLPIVSHYHPTWAALREFIIFHKITKFMESTF